MKRSFRQLADAEILDRAASLFAQRGVDKTSIQDVADAVGLSKAGLLHHYPSKDALHGGVVDHATALGRSVADLVSTVPAGPGRDRLAVDALIDVALHHPGLVAFMLAPATEVPPRGTAGPDPVANEILQIFGVNAERALAAPAAADPEVERLVRVIAALAGLAVLTLSAHRADRTSAWRPLMVATCLDALGHSADA